MKQPTKRAQNKRLSKRVGIVVLVAGAIAGLVLFFSHTDIAVLNPKGTIALKEFHLIVFGTILSLLIIVPVFVMTFAIVWKYRAHNKATYTPNWDHSRKLETIWWTVPLIVILVLAGVTWQSSHDLDPFKPIDASVSDVPPIKVQVVALQWKWLFIYPEQGVASVNYLEFPSGTPIDFEITSDAPMNSFWIPKLGGQVYAMSGMSTQLHLIANKPGEYRGVSANLSGEGFAGMNFIARSIPNVEFADWIQTIKRSSPVLDMDSYNKLSQPSKNNQPSFYNFGGDGTSVYDTVVGKYMSPTSTTNSNSTTHGGETIDQFNQSSGGMMQGMQQGHGMRMEH